MASPLMAILLAQPVVRRGMQPLYAAASAGGDTFSTGSSVVLHVRNGGAASTVVTVPTFWYAMPGVKATDLTVSVPAGQERFVGPFPRRVFSDPVVEVATVTCSVTTSVTLAALEVTGGATASGGAAASVEVHNAAEMTAAFATASNEGTTVLMRGSPAGVDYGPVTLNSARASTVTFQVAPGEKVTVSPTIGGTNVAIRGAHLGNTTVNAPATDVLFEYCYVLDNSILLEQGAPANGPKRVTIRRCEFQSPTPGGDVLLLHAGQDVIIEENYVHNTIWGGEPNQHKDFLQIFAPSNFVDRVTIRRNLFKDIHSHVWTIKDATIGQVVAEENVLTQFENTGLLPMYFYVGAPIIYRRNVSWDTGITGLGIYAGIGSGLVIERNVLQAVFDADGAIGPNLAAGGESNNVISTESWSWAPTGPGAQIVALAGVQFTNPAADDWRLRSTDPGFGQAGVTWKRGDWAYGPPAIGAL
jgi:hypothetical protein